MDALKQLKFEDLSRHYPGISAWGWATVFSADISVPREQVKAEVIFYYFVTWKQCCSAWGMGLGKSQTLRGFGRDFYVLVFYEILF